MEFHKDLSVMGWEKVRERQVQRLPLVNEWVSIVNLKKGASLLDIGPGPGVFLNEYASIVGEEGQITALEKDQEAINYALRKYKHSNVNIICWDAEKSLNDKLGYFHAITLTDVLHHSDSPAHILRNIFKQASEETVILIAEFDPEAEGLIGPPLKNRLAMNDLKLTLQSVGYEIVKEGKQAFEHYYLLIKIKAPV
ncbi:methyltransferase domain-containing protein [Paenibacillus chondroitinus]|uniref:Methyltransferase domain-containing protein n=1 Tax=Paenibacillus chondroitinus TaxID=59842 RepID=A0ABU6DKX0_9BACL|nr:MULTISPECIES: methyltransferase domain-containing protein [Paenibacillus]MCY9657132.1 class I SAM-dependent methyltransferase [Paenibacillus anseongense]MEB4798415.1 methyltransferase domain-containing protein [Paenibacillus chondroitinus]